SGYELLPDLTTRLEPGLQAWGEIIALGAALDWIAGFRAATGETVGEREERLSGRLFDGLATMPRVALVNTRASSVISFLPERVDAHRLAAFLGSAGVMVRSGHFCAHHWLADQRGLAPLVRFSVGAHNDEADVERALDVMARLMKGL
ncbi:MAG TPA: aminotransferase class V-fold PLP-dependent enzyme, partial [Microbacterium sp.]|nr:aminotransferase class V-fold PLP-dependent enzyme [Microbacterium sp.]